MTVVRSLSRGDVVLVLFPFTIAVVPDPDVAAVFHSSEAVNTFPRSVISVLPASTTKSV